MGIGTRTVHVGTRKQKHGTSGLVGMCTTRAGATMGTLIAKVVKNKSASKRWTTAHGGIDRTVPFGKGKPILTCVGMISWKRNATHSSLEMCARTTADTFSFLWTSTVIIALSAIAV